jgi:hypothetical protein
MPGRAEKYLHYDAVKVQCGWQVQGYFCTERERKPAVPVAAAMLVISGTPMICKGVRVISPSTSEVRVDVEPL